jgi:hypothetical protein
MLSITVVVINAARRGSITDDEVNPFTLISSNATKRTVAAAASRKNLSTTSRSGKKLEGRKYTGWA